MTSQTVLTMKLTLNGCESIQTSDKTIDKDFLHKIKTKEFVKQVEKQTHKSTRPTFSNNAKNLRKRFFHFLQKSMAFKLVVKTVCDVTLVPMNIFTKKVYEKICKSF